MTESREKLARALWAVYSRPDRPVPWETGGNLPWNDPDFSNRMLVEHLDESHGAATRTERERKLQIKWLWKKLALKPGSRLLDATCGPGLYAVEFAERNCEVYGIDFGPSSIRYARDLAASRGIGERCRFVEQDIRAADLAPSDAAILLYGQLAVFTREEAKALLARIAASLCPGGCLCVELLNQDRVDKEDSNWWFTDDKGLWGERPFLHLGERFWYPDQALSLERFQILFLESGERVEIQLCDQTYSIEEMTEIMKQAGFATVDLYPAWDGLRLYDAGEWNVFIARKSTGNNPS